MAEALETSFLSEDSTFFNNFNIEVPFNPIYPEQQITESLNKLSTKSDDGDNAGVKFRKRIRVGNHYQARIPKISNETDSEGQDELLWNPLVLEADKVEEFLMEVSSSAKHSIPMGNHLRDDENALYILQQNNHDVGSAYGLINGCSKKLQSWSEEECRSFEKGLLNFGKNFFLIQKYRLPSKSVGDLVQFYYLWKKTERYDLFASRMRGAKKKYALNPGIPDLMCRYLGKPKGDLGADVQFLLNDGKEVTKDAVFPV